MSRLSRLATALPALTLLLAACSSEQLYNSAQGVRQDNCKHLTDYTEYGRCMDSANKPYEQYKQETEPGK